MSSLERRGVRKAANAASFIASGRVNACLNQLRSDHVKKEHEFIGLLLPKSEPKSMSGMHELGDRFEL